MSVIMRTIDPYQALRELRVVANLNPNFVYSRVTGLSSCVYLHPDSSQPDCIIGHVLQRLDVDLQALKSNGENGKDINSIDLTRYGLKVSPVAQAIWRAAQTVQDHGGTWGEAAGEAEKVFQLCQSWRTN